MKGDFDDVEVGFVNGLVELYKLRDRISKYRNNFYVSYQCYETQTWYIFVQYQNNVQIFPD